MRIDHEATSGPPVLAAAEFQREVVSLLQRLQDRLDAVFDEVLAQAALKRRAPASRRLRLARVGGR
jgi:hypothetical protein